MLVLCLLIGYIAGAIGMFAYIILKDESGTLIVRDIVSIHMNVFTTALLAGIFWPISLMIIIRENM